MQQIAPIFGEMLGSCVKNATNLAGKKNARSTGASSLRLRGFLKILRRHLYKGDVLSDREP